MKIKRYFVVAYNDRLNFNNTDKWGGEYHNRYSPGCNIKCVYRDDSDRLHRFDGPAVMYYDGSYVCYVHGEICTLDELNDYK